MNAWGGISTLGLGLSLLWTEGSKRGVTLAQIINWTSVKTAEHASLGDRKGQRLKAFWSFQVTHYSFLGLRSVENRL